jgi:excinuclease ABC subunit A
MDDAIRIVGACEHNLKNIDIEIPRNKLTVVTGLSGSGKSSLAFDTLFAEGQRRYVESLSAYARQFLDQMQKPAVEHIEGLSPAIAIEQRTAGSNPRSIVATTTEIHDYLRLLYAHIGIPHCPKCGKVVSRHSVEDIVEHLLSFPEKTKVILLAPRVAALAGDHKGALDQIRKQGYIRVRVDGQLCELESVPALKKSEKHSIDVVVDRLVINAGVRARLADSIELSLKEGDGSIEVLSSKGTARAAKARGEAEWTSAVFSEKLSCAACGIRFEPLTSRSFSFNSPYGACPTCAGLGTRQVLDESLLVPDAAISLDKGAIPAWRSGNRTLITYYKRMLRGVSKHFEFSLETPFCDLTAEQREILLHGSGEIDVEFTHWRKGTARKTHKPFEGVVPNLERRYAETESEYVRQRLRRYMSRQTCPTCEGRRLRPESTACTVGGCSIVDFLALSISDAISFFEALSLSDYEQQVAAEVVREIRQRLGFLSDVGLNYLTLDRQSGTLSGGEAQRLRLATQIGSGLTGILYVLDEPTIGLHVRDNARLIAMLRGLRDRGNTVVVVEHDEMMIRDADYIIDLGPGAGAAGGHIVFSGTIDELIACPTSLTGQFLRREAEVHVPAVRKPVGDGVLGITGAAANNLKQVDVDIPLGLLVCVTGVSGSGKSSLVDDILKKALFRKFHGGKNRPGPHKAISGTEHLDKVVVIDQSAIGRTPRSNPATYTGAFGLIRKFFSETAASKVRGYGPGRYSFNVKGGRCESCKGDGLIRLEMHFLPDVYVTCERCRGLRYNRETLEVLYGGKNIAEVLAMTIAEALEFFERIPTIERRLRTLAEVGLGYLQLGQSATTLSGGEAQRVKLSAELSKVATGRTLYLLDEPTTGLHFADTQRLLQVLERLREAGNSVVVIEHNMDVIKSADYIIDLGPEGGDGGGQIVATGTPEDVAKCKGSWTGLALKEIFR